jgi:hypothetical protein
MSVDSYRSLSDNSNLVFENRNICSINKPLSRQLVYSFSEQVYKLQNKTVYKKGLSDNPEQNQK